MFRKKKPTFIIAFDATTQAIQLTNSAPKTAFPEDSSPVPREITGCGLCLESRSRR